MDEIEQNEADISNDETLLQEEVEEVKPTPKKEYTAEQKLARVERLRAKYMKELGIETKVDSKSESKRNPGELDKADYAYFVAKGFDEDEDIEFLQSKMAKWDMTAREILKDEDVIGKLKGMKIEREVKAATPSSTKRSSGGNIDNVDYWIAKFEKTGEYPDDFALKSAVVNAIADRENPNKPPWR